MRQHGAPLGGQPKDCSFRFYQDTKNWWENLAYFRSAREKFNLFCPHPGRWLFLHSVGESPAICRNTRSKWVRLS